MKDSGPGVPAGMEERVFEAHVTTKPLGVGTGLGLAVGRNILAAHGGTFGLKRGTLGRARFVVRLLAGAADAGAAATARPAAALRRALVVDDEPDVGAALPELLEVQGIAAEVPGDIPAAVARPDRGGIDLVLCDLRMPGRGALYRHALTTHPELRGRFAFVIGGMVAGPSAIVGPGSGAPTSDHREAVHAYGHRGDAGRASNNATVGGLVDWQTLV